MGEIEEDMNYLLGFLRARNARLVIVIDDLDRCEESDIVEILQAVILLLNDCPITCFLAIDSRIVVSVLNVHMEKFCPKGSVSGREYLDKIIQLPINIGSIDDDVKKKYIEFSSEGKSLTVKNLLDRIKFFKNQKLFGEDLREWEEKVESVNNPTTRLQSAVTYLSSQDKLKYSGNIPSVQELTKDKEQLDNFLLSVSRAMNDIINANISDSVLKSGGNNGVEATDSNAGDSGPPQDTDGESSNSVSSERLARDENTFDTSEYNRIYSPGVPPDADIGNGGGPAVRVSPQVSPDAGIDDSVSPERPVADENPIDMSEYNRIYSPILNQRELSVFKQLSFIIPGIPRSIKRILNIYSLARTFRLYKDDDENFDNFSTKMMKFIILLERWPYATSLMIEVINRLNYERDDKENGLSLDKNRFDNRNRNFDTKELFGRILNHYAIGPEYNSLDSLELYCLYGVLEQELLRHDAGALRSILSRDHDIRLFKKCLFHTDNGEVLMVHDITKLMPYAFNLNLMLLDHAREIIGQIMIQTPKNGYVREDMIIPFSSLV